MNLSPESLKCLYAVTERLISISDVWWYLGGGCINSSANHRARLAASAVSLGSSSGAAPRTSKGDELPDVQSH